MEKIGFISILSFSLVCLTFYLPLRLSGQSSGGSMDEGHPNIIFILTDDQRWDALGHAGNPSILTPEMDRLAREGVYFKNAFVTTPICAASRASILTSQYERSHQYTFGKGNLREELVGQSYPAQFKSSKYYSGFFGKLGVNIEHPERLFDTIEQYNVNTNFADRRGYFYKTIEGDTVHLTEYTGSKAVDFINSAPGDRPFVLSLSFSAPHANDPAHEQYFWPESVDQLYRDQWFENPIMSSDEDFNALPDFVRQGFNRERWYWRFDTSEKYQSSIRGYYRMITAIDLEIGKIRSALKTKGLDQNTVIIIMGDNGYFLGERQLAGKWLLYDNSIRVPLILYDPRRNGPMVIHESALNIDVAPTLLAIAEIEIPQSWQGQSLTGFLEGQHTHSDRDTFLIEHLWDFKQIPAVEGVRSVEWKYFRYRDYPDFEELYNLGADPLEANNLAHDLNYQEIVVKMRRKLEELINHYSTSIRSK